MASADQPVASTVGAPTIGTSRAPLPRNGRSSTARSERPARPASAMRARPASNPSRATSPSTAGLLGTDEGGSDAVTPTIVISSPIHPGPQS
ncbi:MAG: hypothetical protein AVDCRST_MAG18-1399 [uncultured Thermomicrobiales bacterium]|uniref:Uncharacterized protein n=1 Tax=uncultured Thermomicrobiales bacterium TaxID=1645740 RepID=A0A6J4V1Y1_9BACT|nr:MAG: hypothetical protein AVDCRST_MAG18-1399 [uncultured Thermomicrobiales bacterium]